MTRTPPKPSQRIDPAFVRVMLPASTVTPATRAGIDRLAKICGSRGLAIDHLFTRSASKQTPK